MRRIVLFLALLLPCGAQEIWKAPHTFSEGGVQVQLLNWEITRDRKALLVHAKLQNVGGESLYFDWRSVFYLQTSEEQNLRSNFDALVDRNGAGLTRTVGEFRLEPREKARITIPFLLGEDDLPGRLVLPDGRLSEMIR